MLTFPHPTWFESSASFAHVLLEKKKIPQISANGNIIKCILNSSVIGNCRFCVFCTCGGNPVFHWQQLTISVVTQPFETCRTCCMDLDGTPGQGQGGLEEFCQWPMLQNGVERP